MKIAIDGAARGNGKPDCVASGGMFVVDGSNCFTNAKYELNSTNQRGELIGLRLALEHILATKEDEALIYTDSEYIFNAVQKEWPQKWEANHWVTSLGEELKNRDAWEYLLNLLREVGESFVIVYVKGHVMHVPRVAQDKLMLDDMSGYKLFSYCMEHIDEYLIGKAGKKDEALRVMKNNNGFDLQNFNQACCMNSVADAIATLEVEKGVEKATQWL